MELNKIQMTAIVPSAFGMPVCGHASVSTLVGSAATTTGASVRDRQAEITGDLGLAFAYVPGTSAWSPPIS